MTQVQSVPRGVFKGQNFMTPNWLAYFVTEHQGRTAYIEISTGTGLSGEPLYGVTYRKADGGRFDPDPSFCTRSKSEAMSGKQEVTD